MGYIDGVTLTEKGSFAARLYGYELQAAEFLFSGLLDELDSTNMAVLAMASVLEAKKEPTSDDLSVSAPVRKRAVDIVSRIRKAESKVGLQQLTPELSFSLSTMIKAWLDGEDFEVIERMADMDEGHIVRNVRRTIQVLREIRDAAAGRADISNRISEAIEAINRDVVDAERQLQAGAEKDSNTLS